MQMETFIDSLSAITSISILILVLYSLFKTNDIDFESLKQNFKNVDVDIDYITTI